MVMAITGLCLVLFVTFHCLMNGVALFWPSGYNAICEFLGANWYALIASAGLAALFVLHIIYALWLTIQNRKARGNDRYEVKSVPPGVEWSSQNMLVLGFVVLAFLVLHLIQFWAKMQLAEILHFEHVHQGVEVPPAAGTLFIQIAFAQIWTPIVYIIALVALWFHLNHGFWSMFQSAGWNGQTWLPRLKKISFWWTSIVVALFIAQAVVFTVRAHTCDFDKQMAEYKEWKSAQYALDTDTENLGEPWSKAAACTTPCAKSETCNKACTDCDKANCNDCDKTDCKECEKADCNDCNTPCRKACEGHAECPNAN